MWIRNMPVRKRRQSDPVPRMAAAQRLQALDALSDHLLRDIGVRREPAPFRYILRI